MKNIDPDRPFFTIGTVADILGISARMLRFYDEKGIIQPSRSVSNHRLYSLKDIDLLAYVQYLICVKKVNVAGVLELQRVLKKMKEYTRQAFMQEIQHEIDSLPENKKELFIKGDISISENEGRDHPFPDSEENNPSDGAVPSQ